MIDNSSKLEPPLPITYGSADEAQAVLNRLGFETEYVAVYVSQQRAIKDTLPGEGWYLRKSNRNEYLIKQHPVKHHFIPPHRNNINVWNSMKNMIIQDIEVDYEVNRDAHRPYQHIYVYWYVMVNGIRIRVNEIIYKGQDEVNYILSTSIFQFRERHKELIGKPLSDAVSKHDFLTYAILSIKQLEIIRKDQNEPYSTDLLTDDIIKELSEDPGELEYSASSGGLSYTEHKEMTKNPIREQERIRDPLSHRFDINNPIRERERTQDPLTHLPAVNNPIREQERTQDPLSHRFEFKRKPRYIGPGHEMPVTKQEMKIAYEELMEAQKSIQSALRRAQHKYGIL